MINFQYIWIIYPRLLTIFIIISYILIRIGQLKNAIAQKLFVTIGALLGFFMFALPFFKQPTFSNIFISYIIGIPITLFGLIFRIYPMLYLKIHKTTTNLGEVKKVVDTGPYRIMRHPQYFAGIILMLGWFLIWGAIYCLYLLPLFIFLIFVQAFVEEKYILEKEFGKEYIEYKKTVKMFLPTFKK
ncbi:MAG: isoprenylcysteine carboxylmethyltransferase family protein [Candidatus Hydromicrobium sp.]|nr:isoprenylcysteine carboxylmethyltransferase family protein [Chloroflexota bacterium]MBE3128858.1 isoprenylcysteine carboxylmethyltransferase family protein [Actinomycetota bacterium]